MLEYHLDTLTNRNQNTEFERFARRLAEREICPNLLPQTGPTGGGDSKVDAETYPVSDELSLGWYVGVGREAASERWAFAFSAKKEWRSKVRSDIAKIAATGRGYTKAFFVSNQFIPDRIRAEFEDELREKHGLDVRILDRSWVVERVFSGQHESLAIEELGLTTVVRNEIHKGPLDIQRERNLEELEKRIETALQEGRLGLSLVDDCIEAAELSRSLERPRTEVEGRFHRAERVAKQYGTTHQHLNSIYQMAWTAFWWYEDYKSFAELYNTVEKIAKGSGNSHDLELLHNLWNLLFGAVNRGELDRQEVGFDQHTSTLTTELERLSEEHDRPSTALQARTLLLLQRLTNSVSEESELILRELQEVVKRCEGLVGYPLEPLVKILIDLGDLIGGIAAYEELFETILTTTSIREGEVSAARMLLKRGAQQLDADRPYEAIRFLGRALRRLYKHESRTEVIRALYLCGSAYERVGLLWAARGTVVAAASIATNEFWTQSDVTYLQAACYNRLKWLELQLGRLPHILAWHEIDVAVRHVLIDQGYPAEELFADEIDFDAILGMLLLRADIWQLKRLTSMPDILDAMNLHRASLALRFALGHEDEIHEDMTEEENEVPFETFLKWRDQPAAEDLPPQPSLYESRMVTLASTVLGCRVSVESQSMPPCVELAESILAALESLLSTSFGDHVVAREPVLTINIRKGDFAQQPFEFEMRDRDGRPHVEVRCASFDPHHVPLDAQRQVKEQLFELLVNILAHVFFVGDIKEVVRKLFGDELALERSIDFTSSFVTLANVLGDDPKTQLAVWVHPDARRYPLKRREEWDTADKLKKSEAASSEARPKLTMGEGEPPAELHDPARVKHTQMETVSLIRETLWARATWSGTAFSLSPGNAALPMMAPIFRDAVAAGQIFALWRKELGVEDTEERLRVTIVRGINKTNPYAYRLVIGSNPTLGFTREDIKFAVMVFRLNTMNPSTDRNLNGFLASYTALGSYILTHAVIQDEASRPVFIRDNYIIKRELYVRDGWQIGRNDVDSAGIKEEDDPIIPADQENAPVLELLKWKRAHRHGKPSQG